MKDRIQSMVEEVGGWAIVAGSLFAAAAWNLEVFGRSPPSGAIEWAWRLLSLFVVPGLIASLLRTRDTVRPGRVNPYAYFKAALPTTFLGFVLGAIGGVIFWISDLVGRP